MQSLAFQARENESVDRIAYPLLVTHRGSCWPPWRNERPERLPAGALDDPTADPVDFGRFQGIAPGIGRRHADRGVRGSDPPHQFAALWIAGYDREAALAQVDAGAGFGVEPQFGFPFGGVGTVAGKALVGEDRAYVAIEFDLLAGQRSGSQHRACANPGRRSSVSHVGPILPDRQTNFVNSDTTLEFRT